MSLLQKRRMEAAAMFVAGARTVDVARAFNVAWRTAHKWREAFLANGLDGLRSRGRPGREPLLDAAQRKRLATILRVGAMRHGFPDERWTLARVREVTERVFGVKCSKISVWRILRQTKATAQVAARIPRRQMTSNVAARDADPVVSPQLDEGRQTA